MLISGIERTRDRITTIDQLLADAGSGKIRIFTSTLSITEVAYEKLEQDQKTLSQADEKRIDALWGATSPITLVEFHELIAYQAKDLIREIVNKGWSLKPPDAIHLATAMSIQVDEFHTYDKKLKKYGSITGLKIKEPISQGLPLEFEPDTER